MSVVMVQTKCKLTTLSYSSNCSIFSAKKLEATSATKKQQNIDARKEMEDSRLNAIECLKTY